MRMEPGLTRPWWNNGTHTMIENVESVMAYRAYTICKNYSGKSVGSPAFLLMDL